MHTASGQILRHNSINSTSETHNINSTDTSYNFPSDTRHSILSNAFQFIDSPTIVIKVTVNPHDLLMNPASEHPECN